MGRPRRKYGRTYNFYLSDEVDALIEQYRGEKSRSAFIEEAVKFYISHLAGDTKEGDEKQKIDNHECNPPASRGNRARSKVRDLGSRPVGVRGFESLPLHSLASLVRLGELVAKALLCFSLPCVPSGHLFYGTVPSESTIFMAYPNFKK